MRIDNVINLMTEVQTILNDPALLLHEVTRQRLVCFYEDLEFYSARYEKFNSRLHMGWGALITNYLNWLIENCREVEQIVALHKVYASRIDKIEKLDTILFSQRTIASKFADHDSVSKGRFPFTGMALLDVSKKVEKDPSLADYFPLRVIWHEEARCWVTLNNRGYAMLSCAGVAPTRIRPDIEETSEELSRFSQPQRINLPGNKFFESREVLLMQHFRKLSEAENKLYPNKLQGRMLPPSSIVTAEQAGCAVFAVKALSVARYGLDESLALDARTTCVVFQ